MRWYLSAIDLDAVAEDKAADGASDAVICWIRTSAWRDILKVEVCVIRKSVSMCLFSLCTS